MKERRVLWFQGRISSVPLTNGRAFATVPFSPGILGTRSAPFWEQTYHLS